MSGAWREGEGSPGWGAEVEDRVIVRGAEKRAGGDTSLCLEHSKWLRVSGEPPHLSGAERERGAGDGRARAFLLHTPGAGPGHPHGGGDTREVRRGHFRVSGRHGVPGETCTYRAWGMYLP